MTTMPILSGATSLAHLKLLLPIAYQYRNITEDQFVAEALTKAQTFDGKFSAKDIQSILGTGNSTGTPAQSSTSMQSGLSWVDAINANHAWIEANASIYRTEFNDFIEPSKFRTQFDNHTVTISIGKRTQEVGKGTLWLK